jgi:hypothetical protein
MKPPAVLGLGVACAALAGAALPLDLGAPHFTQAVVEKIRAEARTRVITNNKAAVVYKVEVIIVSPRRVVGFVNVTIGAANLTPGFHCDMGDDWHYICAPD